MIVLSGIHHTEVNSVRGSSLVRKMVRRRRLVAVRKQIGITRSWNRFESARLK